MQYTQAQLKQVASTAVTDMLLFSHAVELFTQRVLATEAVLQQEFFCEIKPRTR